MIPLTNFRMARASDIAPATLVAWATGNTYSYGLTVSIQRHANKSLGILRLSSGSEVRAPQFASASGEYLLVFPAKPVITWNTQLSDLVRPYYSEAAPGHIAVSHDQLLVNGAVLGNGASESAYWDLASGEQSSVDPATAVFITNWDLCIHGTDGKLDSVLKYRPEVPA